MKRHLYEYENLVVGGNLQAIFFAYINNYPLLFKETQPPLDFEYFEHDFPIEKLMLTKQENFLNTPYGAKKFANQKREVYDRLLFSLSLAGLVPVADKVRSISIEDEETIKISTERARQVNINFKKLYIFEPKIVYGLDIEEHQEVEECTVYDTFKIRSKTHDFNLIDIDDIEKGHDFVNKIWFMPKEKPNTVVIKSRSTREKINDSEYGVINIKYKLKGIFEKAGIEKRNYDKELFLDFLSKEVYYVDKNVYKSSDSIIIDRRTEREVCLNIAHHQQMTSSLLGAYPWRINHLFLDSSGTIRWYHWQMITPH